MSVIGGADPAEIEAIQGHPPRAGHGQCLSVDNVLALQAAAADPAKLVAYDRDHRVLGVRIVSLS